MSFTVTFNGKTITASELAQSRSGDTLGSETRRWVVEGSDDADDIVGGLQQIIPRSLPNGFLFNKVSYEFPAVERGDNSIWLCSVEYVSAGGTRSGTVDVPVGTARLRRTARTENELMTMPQFDSRIASNVQYRFTAPTITPVEYFGIGDNGQTYEGAQIPRPVVSFAYDFTVPGLEATPTFWQLCDRCVGALNTETWKGFRRLTVLCTSIEGTFATNQDTTLSFNFQYKPWQPGKTIRTVYDPVTDNFTGEIKLDPHSGWSYWDVHTRTKVYQNPSRIFVEIQQIDLYLLFPGEDFNDLNIPGPDLGTIQ